jgi:membrane associated rhomboid family serine protease
MLIIPLSGKLSKSNLPALTICIILINCFVFFVFQHKDDEHYGEAMEMYFTSGLAAVEVFHYLKYIEHTEKGRGIPIVQEPRELSQEAIVKYLPSMWRDREFMQKLLSDQIILPDTPLYNTWKELRARYEQLLSKATAHAYGYLPALKNYLGLLTYMFLHADLMHLIGNMLFLWFVGCVLEIGIGRPSYAGLYALTGVLAAFLFGLIYAGNATPLIGASGAVSGLIGAYTVAYGRTRIKVFYSVGFYFNYTKVPAIVLLPVWIASEILMLLLRSSSPVAYVAHVAGLGSGALLMFLHEKAFKAKKSEVFMEDPSEKIPGLLEEATECAKKLDISAARPLFEQVLAIDSQNHPAMIGLYNLEKITPQSEHYHKASERLLAHLSRIPSESETLLEVFREYNRLSKKIRLSRDLLYKMIGGFISSKHLREAESLIAYLLKVSPQWEHIPLAVLNLAKAYLRTGMKEKAARCLQILSAKYPQTNESKIARNMLSRSR